MEMEGTVTTNSSPENFALYAFVKYLLCVWFISLVISSNPVLKVLLHHKADVFEAQRSRTDQYVEWVRLLPESRTHGVHHADIRIGGRERECHLPELKPLDIVCNAQLHITSPPLEGSASLNVSSHCENHLHPANANTILFMRATGGACIRPHDNMDWRPM